MRSEPYSNLSAKQREALDGEIRFMFPQSHVTRRGRIIRRGDMCVFVSLCGDGRISESTPFPASSLVRDFRPGCFTANAGVGNHYLPKGEELAEEYRAIFRAILKGQALAEQ